MKKTLLTVVLFALALGTACGQKLTGAGVLFLTLFTRNGSVNITLRIRAFRFATGLKDRAQESGR